MPGCGGFLKRLAQPLPPRYADIVRVALALLLALLLLPACGAIQRLGPPHPAAQAPGGALPAELAERFAYAASATPITPELSAIDEDDDVERLRGVYDTTCPVTGRPSTVTFDFFRAKRPSGRRPAVVLVPILAGKYPECEHLGRFLGRNGLHAFFVHREDGLLDFSTSEPFETRFRRGIVNIRRTLDWALARPDVDPARIGLVGISLGAISGIVLCAVEPRVRAAVLIMGGGDLPGILSDSIETPVRRYKAHKMRDNGWTEEQFKSHVAMDLRSDPLAFAPHVGPARVQQYISLYDNRVPTRYQWMLWDALGRPEGFAIPIGHYTAIVHIPFAERESLAFLRRRLEIDASPDAVASSSLPAGR